MRIVIDTNMVFSLLLGKNVRMRDTFFDPTHVFYAPNYIIGELFEKKEKIMRCSALSEPEIYELFYRILSRIKFVAEEFVTLEHRSQARPRYARRFWPRIFGHFSIRGENFRLQSGAVFQLG